MRRIMFRITLLAAALMIIAAPVLAEDRAEMPGMNPAEQGLKNECLLVSMNCGNQVDSIQERIDRIQIEIGRGTSVYTNDELKRLENRLDEANRTLNELMMGGA